MIGRIFAIFILSALLGLLLYFQPWKQTKVSPRFVDRLPEAHFIGTSNLLPLARSLQSAMSYYKISFRSFTSPEFILGQAKAFGLNVQSPVHFFSDEQDGKMTHWGVMIRVSDSSKIMDGIHVLRKLTDVQDTIVHDWRVFKSHSQNMALAYGHDWLLVASYDGFENYLYKVVTSENEHVSPKWNDFLLQEHSKKQDLVVNGVSPSLSDLGVESILVSAKNDSSSIHLKAHITQVDSLPFSLKPQGFRLPREEFTKHMINGQFNIANLRKNPESPIYQLLNQVARKVSFPLQEFLNAWEGDIAFRQGGFQTIREKYVESEFDEDFNVSEVVKYKETKIEGFSLYLSMNERKYKLIKRLRKKGILTTEENGKVRLLFSPPMHMRMRDSSLLFYTASYAPALDTNSMAADALWTIDYTPFQFTLDSTSTKELYGRITIPLQRIVRKGMRFMQ